MRHIPCGPCDVVNSGRRRTILDVLFSPLPDTFLTRVSLGFKKYVFETRVDVNFRGCIELPDKIIQSDVCIDRRIIYS